jgi:hypothetical protein
MLANTFMLHHVHKILIHMFDMGLDFDASKLITQVIERGSLVSLESLLF